MDIDQDEHEHEHEHSSDDDSGPATASTRAGKRVAELQQVEENIAALLHFAGCTLASLHPDPLSSFTVREIATDDADDDDDDDDDEGHQGSDIETKKKPATTRNAASDQDPEAAAAAKLQEFAKYADGYFATLNDVQLALRTSIRHLRVSRTSASALTDPSYGSLLVSRNAKYPLSDQNYTTAVGPGGVAFDGGAAAAGGGGGEARYSSAGKQEEDNAGWDMRASRLPSSSGPGPGSRSSPTVTTRRSVAALEVERDALQELVAALDGGEE
ncbi:hypothetical protein RHOSPDRAFT_36645 [Rhodotorula sp. JG-1b]|nr:hypothetical protein RHOSPDRAFT_36645 [Rhodotorula sp. JG-1b]